MGYPLVAVEKAEVEPAEECERNEGYERGCSVERHSHKSPVSSLTAGASRRLKST